MWCLKFSKNATKLCIARISALASKICQIKKIKHFIILNDIKSLIYMIMCLYFSYLTNFSGRNPSNNFVAFLENLRHHNFVLRLHGL